MTRSELHELLGTRWALPLLGALEPRALRSSELRSRNVGLSSRMQAVTLRSLAAAGLVDRLETYTSSVHAKRVTYALTARGRLVLAWSTQGPDRSEPGTLDRRRLVGFAEGM